MASSGLPDSVRRARELPGGRRGSVASPLDRVVLPRPRASGTRACARCVAWGEGGLTERSEGSFCAILNVEGSVSRQPRKFHGPASESRLRLSRAARARSGEPGGERMGGRAQSAPPGLRGD